VKEYKIIVNATKFYDKDYFCIGRAFTDSGYVLIDKNDCKIIEEKEIGVIVENYKKRSKIRG
jgi:hypothetical protein